MGQARELFLSTLSSSDASRIINVSTSIMSDDYGSLNTLNLNYRADISSTLLRILGFPTVPVTGKSASTIGTYYSARFHFLVDASDSMGLAATEADRNQLINLTQTEDEAGCEFACHSSNRLEIARANNITLRIDVAKAGITQIIDLARTHSARPDQFHFSLQAIGTNSAIVQPITASFNSILSGVSKLEVGYGHNPGADAHTFFDIALPQANSWLNAHGVNTELDMIVLITDGVQSKRNGTGDEIRLLDQEYCNLLKSRGRKLSVIYTRYIPIPHDHAYIHHVAPFHDQIEPNLRACASSPELFAEGESPQEIMQAFEKIFWSAERTLIRLAS